MVSHNSIPKFITFLLLFPAISGCVEDSVDNPLELDFSVDFLVGGEVQNLRILSSERMSVLVAYFIYNPDKGYFQNGTTLFSARGRRIWRASNNGTMSTTTDSIGFLGVFASIS